MAHWQQQFAQQMDALCSQSSSLFERFADETLQPAFEAMCAYLEQWHYEFATPPCDEQRRAYRFSLTEDGYVLVWFRLEGFDALECEYEYALPGLGRTRGVRTSGGLRSADGAWVERCFEAALGDFVGKFVEAGNRRMGAEAVMA